MKTNEDLSAAPHALRILRGFPHSGILCSLIGNFLLASSYVLIKSALRCDNTFLVGLLRVSTEFCLLAPVTAVHRDHPLGFRGERRLVTLWAISNGLSQFLFVCAISLISATDASTITMTYPILLTIAGPLVLGEPFRKTYVMSAAMTVSGVFLIGRPSFLFSNQDSNLFRTIGVVCSLGASAMSGLACLTNRKIQATPVWVFSQQFAFFSVVGYTVATALSQTGFHLLSAEEWAKGVGCGVAYTAGSLLVSLGYQLDEVGPLSVVGMLEVPFVLFLQVTALGQVPPWTTCAGVLLVLTGVLMTLLRKWDGGRESLKVFFVRCCRCGVTCCVRRKISVFVIKK